MYRRRSFWKLPYIHPIFFKNTKKYLFQIRHSEIPFSLLKKKIFIYNGIWFLSANITERMVGYKLGEFSFSRKCDGNIHKKKKKKKR